MGTRTVIAVLAVAALGAAIGPGVAAAAGPITYTTFFEDPGTGEASDASLERHAIDLVNATPSGARITFAYRDFNRNPVADALIAAHDRGVAIDGVIDGGERARAPVQKLVTAIGADHVVLCGSPTFEFASCIANSIVPSLQHNKFMTFSELADGRHDVVLQTSQNFLFPSQYTYFNDMVEIAGDRRLHDAYVQYVLDMKAQIRSDDHFLTVAGDDVRNTIFTSPRRQRDVDSDDTIVDRLNEIDCSEGGSPDGKGLLRIAMLTFRSERAVIMRKLVALHDAGCDIDGVFSYASGDIIAGLVSAGIRVRPLWLEARGTRRQVLVHDKFWTVDAKSTLTGERTKITYAGSSNWRADEQYSDDLLLRIVDDDVYAAYTAYWNVIAARAVSDLTRPATDSVTPSSALVARPQPNTNGWSRSDATVRIAASDGHDNLTAGLKRLHVEMSGAQNGSWDFIGETDAANVQELPVTAEGETVVTYFAEDAAGNTEAPHSYVVRIDKTAPEIAGLPRRCRLWPPDHRLVHVAEVSASDPISGVDALSVGATSNYPERDSRDIVIRGGSIALRAVLARHGLPRVYRLEATATDLAGNATPAAGACIVRARHHGHHGHWRHAAW